MIKASVKLVVGDSSVEYTYDRERETFMVESVTEGFEESAEVSLEDLPPNVVEFFQSVDK